MIHQMMGQTARIYRATTAADLYGDQTRRVYPGQPSWTGPCRLQLESGSEDRDGRDSGAGTWRLYLPSGPGLSLHDQVEVDIDPTTTHRFEVLAIYPVHRPASGLHHLQVEVRSYAGWVPNAS